MIIITRHKTVRNQTKLKPVDLKFLSTHTQGTKLTFLGRRQLVTEIIFFSRHMEKCGRQKVRVSQGFWGTREQRENIIGNMTPVLGNTGT